MCAARNVNADFEVQNGVLIRYRGGGGAVSIPASVTTIGARAFFNVRNMTSVDIPNSVKRIESSAFEFCSGLKSIVIPKSVTFIDGAVFGGCSSLTNISVDAKNPSYKSVDGNLYSKDCARLLQYAVGKKEKKFIIPSTVNNIFYYAFWGNTALESIEVNDTTGYFVSADGNLYSEYGKMLFQYAPGKKAERFYFYDFVEGVCDSGFSNATALKKVYMNDNLKTIGYNSFQNCTALEEILLSPNLTAIGANAFWNCPKLKNVYNLSALDIKAGADTFGYVAKNADAVHVNQSKNPNFLVVDRKLITYRGNGKVVRVGNGVTAIGKYAFYCCNSIEELYLPETLKEIHPHAFEFCANLKTLHIPAGVEDIITPGFIGCKSLESITVDSKNKNYTSIDGNLYTKDGKQLVQYALGKKDTFFSIPSKVMSLAVGCFFGNTTLKEIRSNDPYGCLITIDGSLYGLYGKKLIQYACGKSDKELRIPEGVETIGMGSVSFGLNLKQVILPSSVQKIEEAAFSYDQNLEAILLPPSLTEIESTSFLGCNRLATIYNYSNLNIVKGANTYGMIGKNAKKIIVKK